MPEDSTKDNTPPESKAPESGPTRIIKEPTAQSNPWYGCAILLLVVATFGFIVTWTVYSGLKQNSEIAAFTVPDAPALPPYSADEPKKQALKQKLGSWAAESKAQKPASLSMTVDELNTLMVIAAEWDTAMDYREIVRFTGMDPASQLLKADIRWKMNNLPFVKAPDRFLAGKATFKPIIENKSLELHIDQIEVPGKAVSQGFVTQLQNWPWLNLAKLKDEVKAPLATVSRFEVSADGQYFILHCHKSEP